MSEIIPAGALANHIAILGKTGSGKTYTAKAIAESLLREKQRVCVVDPTGVWFGLRSSSAGDKAAFPVVVFGGEHADVPLAQHHGHAIAEIIGTSDTSAVLDTRLMGVGERTRFFADFAETLLRKNKGPLHLIIDEAHLFAPQGRVNDPQSGKMLHAANNLVSLGRGIGLRIILITQRPAKLHKDSLTQAETLIALRLIAPQDRRAVEDWIGEWADPKQGRELLSSLPSLPTGEGWVWAPELGILKRAQFPKITTYDSSRAPDGAREQIVLANIDLPSIQQRLEKVAKDAIEHDPKRLLARIAELEKAGKTSAEVDPETINTARRDAARAVHEQYRHVFNEATIALRSASEKLALATSLLGSVDGFMDAITELRPPRPQMAERVDRNSGPVSAQLRPSRPSVKGADHENGSAKGGERKILTALAQYPAGRSKIQIAILAGYSHNGGGFNNYLSALRTKGCIEGSGDRIQITKVGESALGWYEPLPTGRLLLEHWMRQPQLGKAERSILTALAHSYPSALTKDDLGRLTGYEPSGGGFNNALSKLRTLELINGRGELRLSDELA